MAALGDFVGDVAHLEQRRIALALGDERADALDADQFAFVCQFAQCAVGGHLADAEIDNQFVLRGHAMLRRPFAAMDAVEDYLLDAGIERRRCRFLASSRFMSRGRFIAYSLCGGLNLAS